MATSSGSSNSGTSPNVSIGAFVTSLGSGAAVFAAEIAVFYLLKLYLPRIYRPRTYLVPERERTQPPPPGFWRWIIPIFSTKNSEFIHKCGLDAFFFLRYLRMLLKIFIPMALVILPILLPINATGGNSQMANLMTGAAASSATSGNTTVSGLGVLAWGNVSVYNHNRFWAHLVLAVLVIVYVCYVVFDELRGYIRVRQAYMTSPQHRLRASATTVLVKTIPDKWNTVEALDGLFDVFPGGVRNIWLNRDFQALSDKIDLRDGLAKKLESAEYNLIKNAMEKHAKQVKKEAKASGKKKGNVQKDDVSKDGAAEKPHADEGISAGNPHQVRSLRDFFNRDGKDDDNDSGSDSDEAPRERKSALGLGVVGEGLGVVTHGLGAVSQGVTRFGTTGFGAVSHGFSRVGGFARLSRSRKEDLEPPQIAGPTDGSDSTGDATTARPSLEPNGASPPSRGAGAAAPSIHSPTSPFNRQKQLRKDEELLSSGFDDLDAVSQSHWKFWTKNKPMPSPHPHTKEDDESPLTKARLSEPDSRPSDQESVKQVEETEGLDTRVENPESDSANDSSSVSKENEKTVKHKKKDLYAPAYSREVANAVEEDAVWQKYVKQGDRDTMRLPLFGLSWMPHMPTWTFLGKKVDVIYYCRKELARLNLEIESDQKEPEKYPLMNSAFIQFNHQVAAHMACQAAAHHLPQQMTPRMVEISPDDVIWDNMAIKWWEAYLRNFGVILIVAAMVVFWAIPSAFVGGLSHLSNLEKVPIFAWVKDISVQGQAFLEGVVPAVITSLMFILVPIILKFLHRLAGANTGNQIQQSVQMSYFAFLFVNLFLVVTIAAGLTSIVTTLASQLSNPADIPSFLAKNLPGAANYFFSYMILQALSTSAGALAQISTLVVWTLLRPIVDSTPRQRWRRQVKLPSLTWGSFFAPYTNFACIGLIYSVIAPLIMVFNIITFGLFWIAYRYNTLYVNKFSFDTGGLLFPTAINQLFTGLYTMEICLIGLFFLVEEPQANDPSSTTAVCKAQGIIMIVVGLLTILYQVVLNYAFGPLVRYLPITLEDDAVMRDEAFARAQDARWAADHEDGEDEEERVGRQSLAKERSAGEVEMGELETPSDEAQDSVNRTPGPWAAGKSSRSGEFGRESVDLAHGAPNSPRSQRSGRPSGNLHRRRSKKLDVLLHPPESHKGRKDFDAQREAEKEGDYLFGGVSDTIEDLTPEERDALIDRAFRHRALRSRRPCIWIPRDPLGVSDDEVRRTGELTDYVWISNRGATIDLQGKCVFRRSPPDFSDIDLVEL